MTTKFMPYEVFRSNCLRMGASERDVAIELGYNPDTVTDWRRNNSVPKSVALASEGLLRRDRAAGRRMLVVLLPRSVDMTSLTKVLGSLGAVVTEVVTE